MQALGFPKTQYVWVWVYVLSEICLNSAACVFSLNLTLDAGRTEGWTDGTGFSSVRIGSALYW